MAAIFASLFTYGFVIAIASIGGVATFIISYLLPAIALFNMANKAGHPYPWLAFIPFAQTYLEFTLPKKQFKVFFVDTDQRSLMAVITLIAANFGTGIIAGLCTWVGDKLKHLFKEVQDLTAIGVTATLGTIFKSPMFGFIEP